MRINVLGVEPITKAVDPILMSAFAERLPKEITEDVLREKVIYFYYLFIIIIIIVFNELFIQMI